MLLNFEKVSLFRDYKYLSRRVQMTLKDIVTGVADKFVFCETTQTEE